MGSRREKRKQEEAEDAAKSKRKQYVMIGGIAGGVVLVIVVLMIVIPLFRGSGNVVDTRSDTERNSAERSAIQKLMDDDIARAQSRGATKEDIEKIRKGYQESLGKIGK